uniref:dihydrofolate reductase family protein n=1 Tax=Nocardia wallacei TaxID=480035 RepID=UPI002453B1C9
TSSTSPARSAAVAAAPPMSPPCPSPPATRAAPPPAALPVVTPGSRAAAGHPAHPPGFADGAGAARVAGGEGHGGLMGGGAATAALRAGLVDEVVLHQVPILLGGGRPFFHTLPEHIRLRLVEAVPAPGVTHLRYEVRR